MVTIPASITIEHGHSTQKYKWKSKDKTSVYRRKCKRAFVRITGSNFVNKLSKKDISKKQVNVKFYKKNKEWFLEINRTKEKGITLQTYLGSHPYLQLILNKSLPKEIWDEHKFSSKKTYTRSINVVINLDNWGDLEIKPYDFLLDVEKISKDLMKEALSHNFKIDFIPKGRAYDLELIGPKGNKFIFAISSYVAKTESRSKEHRKQKILMDISKILPILHTKKVIPVIISQPLEFKNSWSFTTDNYLNFYKDKFNFIFLTTEFKKGWEHQICKRILELDKNV